MFVPPRRRTRLLALPALVAACGAFAQDGEPENSTTSLASLSLDELMAVEVTTPGKVPEAIRDTPASVYLVDRKDIETYGYGSLTEIIENVPGFYNLDNYDGAGANFGVRGFWNGRSQNGSVAILVNGVPQMRLENWSAPFESINIPVEAIDRIEVSRGPNSVIYGVGASFGAINIITDDSYSRSEIAVSGGSLGSERVAGRWSALGEDSYLTVNVGSHKTDGVDYQLTELTSPEKLAVLPYLGVADPETASLKDRLERRGKYIGLAGGWKWLSFDYTFNRGDVEYVSGPPPVADGSRRVSETHKFAIGLKVPISDELESDTRLIYTDFEHRIDYDGLYPGILAYNLRDYEGWELESLLTYSPSEAFRVLGGVNYQQMNDNWEYTHIPDLGVNNEVVDIERRVTRSVFAQASYQATETLRFVSGARVQQLRPYDRFGYFNYETDTMPTFGGREEGYTNAMPRASVIYQISKSQLIKVMAGDAVKFPPLAAAEFHPERTRTIEINYNVSTENQLWSISVFRNALSDVVIEELRFLEGGLVDVEARRGGAIKTIGVEALATFDIVDQFRAEIGATWQESDNMSQPDGILSYSPKLVAHGKLAYHRERFTASALARYVGSMYSFYNTDPYTPPDDVTFGFFGDSSEAYLVCDASVRWDEIWEGLFVSAQVTNIFDEEIRYPSNPGNGAFLDRGTLAPGRGFRVELGYKF